VRLMNEVSTTMLSLTGNSVADIIEELPVAYVEIDTDGVITRANRAARALHSEDQKEIVGRCAWEFSPRGQVDLDRNNFFDLMKSGEEPPVARRSLYSKGEFRTYELHRSLIHDAQGRPIGIRAATFDVTEAQKAHEEANQARMWLESVLESMPEAIIITDPLGFIRSVNPAVEEMFGWKAAEMVGKTIEKAFPLLSYTSESKEKLSFNMTLQKQWRGVGITFDSNRRQMRVEISTSPISDKNNGFTTGVVSVLRKLEVAP
jgi:PAS domain S-box-containing protein